MTTPFTTRERLISFLRQARPDFDDWQDDTPLVGFGVIDSLTLLQLAVWVESEIGHALDPSAFDLASEWSTVAGVLLFIARERASRVAETAKSE